jgi:hypothetical protein
MRGLDDVSRLDPSQLVREIGPLLPEVAVRWGQGPGRPGRKPKEPKGAETTMPYATVDALPEPVQKLGKDKAAQWMAVFNKVHPTDGEKAAFQAAWGAVKQAEPTPT